MSANSEIDTYLLSFFEIIWQISIGRKQFFSETLHGIKYIVFKI